MGIVLFIITSLTAFCLLYTFLPFKSGKFFGALITALLVGFFSKNTGTYIGCADGWVSQNIGEQGACSHHGGVVIYLNMFGTIALVVSVLVLAVFFYVQYVKFKKKRRVRIRDEESTNGIRR